MNTIWTPKDRNELIKEAVNTPDLCGNRNGYRYAVYPKSSGETNVELDAKRSLVTAAFAKCIYTKNPKYKYMSLGFYYMLIEKIRLNPDLKVRLWSDIIVIIKG